MFRLPTRIHLPWQGPLALLLAAAPLPAQSLGVAPVVFDGVEGDTSTRVPFGYSSPGRFLALYDPEVLPISAPQWIQEIRFRADNRLMPEKKFVWLSVRMSSATRRGFNAVGAFEDNHGTDVLTVVDQGQLILPGRSPNTGMPPAPQPLDIVIPLDEPFPMGLRPVRRKGETNELGLAVELQISILPGGDYWLDSPGSCTLPTTTERTLGPGCVSGLGTPVVLTATESLQAGGTVDYTVTGLAPNRFVMVFAGPFLDQGTFQGQNLPLDLANVPPAQLGLPINTPRPVDCVLHVQPVFVLQGTTDSNGFVRLNGSIPGDPSVIGKRFYSQAVALDFTANPYGIIMSNVLGSRICGPLAAARVFKLGSDTAVSGSVSRGTAPVIELR